jgi:hypothetical protein
MSRRIKLYRINIDDEDSYFTHLKSEADKYTHGGMYDVTMVYVDVTVSGIAVALNTLPIKDGYYWDGNTFIKRIERSK